MTLLALPEFGTVCANQSADDKNECVTETPFSFAPAAEAALLFIPPMSSATRVPDSPMSAFISYTLAYVNTSVTSLVTTTTVTLETSPRLPSAVNISVATAEDEPTLVLLTCVDPDVRGCYVVIISLPTNGALYQISSRGLFGHAITHCPQLVTSNINGVFYQPNAHFHGDDNVRIRSATKLFTRRRTMEQHKRSH